MMSDDVSGNASFQTDGFGNDSDVDANQVSKQSLSGYEDYVLRNTFIITCYSLIVVLSLTGNLLVLRVVFGKRTMRSTTNLLIGNLACSDLLTTTLNIPFNLARLLLANYPFGDLPCFFVPFVQVQCVYVSTLTMTVIAVHRYYTVTRNHAAGAKSQSFAKLAVVVALTWILAALLALPHSVFNRVVEAEYGNQTLIRCRSILPQIDNFDFPLFLSIEAFLTQYAIPLSIICVLYVKIGRIVSRQGVLAAKLTDQRKRRQSEAKRRRIIMLALVVVAFAVCWLPLNLYHLLYDFKLIQPSFAFFMLCHWIALSSVCYNPFIYCWLNESFRKAAKKLFRLLFACCHKTSIEVQEDVSSPRPIDRERMSIAATTTTTLL